MLNRGGPSTLSLSDPTVWQKSLQGQILQHDGNVEVCHLVGNKTPHPQRPRECMV